MDERKKEVLENETIRFFERLEYLKRDIQVIEQTIAHIEDDLSTLGKEFKEIKGIIVRKEKGMASPFFSLTMPKKKMFSDHSDENKRDESLKELKKRS